MLSRICPDCGGPKMPEATRCRQCYRSRPVARFWEKVEKGGPDDCWVWMGAISSNGYGRFNVSAEQHMTAHRYSYELQVGPIPDGLQLDHLCHDETCAGVEAECRHRRCVNPSHLNPVTHRENGIRGKGAPGENARKTHCLKGHPLAGDNLVSTSLAKGRRECLACRNERSKARSQKKVAA